MHVEVELYASVVVGKKLANNHFFVFPLTVARMNLLPCVAQDDFGFIVSSQKALCYHVLARGATFLSKSRMEKIVPEQGEGYYISIVKLLGRDVNTVSILNTKSMDAADSVFRRADAQPFQNRISIANVQGQFGLIFPDLGQFFEFVAESAFFMSIPVRSYLVGC